MKFLRWAASSPAHQFYSTVGIFTAIFLGLQFLLRGTFGLSRPVSTLAAFGVGFTLAITWNHYVGRRVADTTGGDQ